MAQTDILAQERRARMAAERLLDQKQRELFAANAELSRHALALSDEIVEKREEVAVVKVAAEELRGMNDQAMVDLSIAHDAVDIAERRLWESVETIEDGFAVFDAQSVLVAANSAYLAAFDGMECVAPGITYAEIVQILADEGIVDPGDISSRDWCLALLERWQRPQLETKTIKLWTGRFVRLVDRRSENGDTVSLALDITDDIRREQDLRIARNNADAANRAKSAFLAKMSHELRTPMNGVVGMADLLAESKLSEDQMLFVDTIRTSGDALLSLINDVLDFSKMEAAKLVLHTEEFDLERTLTEVIMLFQPSVMTKNVELIVDYDMFLPVGFVGDSGRIRQILTNLIGNAVKFTEAGHVLVRVVGLPDGKTGNMRIHITIEDTGVGIPQDKIDHIFGEFNQVEDEKNRKFEGTGLGLAISKQLVELMSGKVWVDSEYGKGSTFGFFINLATIDVSTPEPDQIPNWINRLIMLSHPSQFARVLSKQMRILGCNVVDLTLQEFSELPALETGDVLVIDGGMPLGFATNALEAMRRSHADIPTILIQHHGTDDPIKASKNLAILRKPVDRRALIKCMNSLETPEIAKRAETVSVVPTEPPQSDTKPVATLTERKMRILAAEDNKTNRLVFSKLVGKLNIDLEFAENGQEALEKWDGFQPDLVFMDISMPIMDGKEATSKIRDQEIREGRARTPIVALTAHAMSGDDDEILAAGLDHYLTKPLRKPAIFEQIENAKPDHVMPVFEPVQSELEAD